MEKMSTAVVTSLDEPSGRLWNVELLEVRLRTCQVNEPYSCHSVSTLPRVRGDIGACANYGP